MRLLTTLERQRRRPAVLLAGLVILNTIADVVPFYFKEVGADPSVGAIGFSRAVILALLSMYFWTKFRSRLWLGSWTSRVIIWMLAYFGLLVWFTSDVPYATSVFLKVFFSMLMFILARRAFRSLEDIALLNRALVVSLVILLVQFVAAQVFQGGLDNSYVAGSIYWGGATPEVMSRIVAYALLTAPFTLLLVPRTRTRMIYNLTFASSAVVLVLLFNRTALAAAAIGYTTIFVLGRSKKRLLIYVLMAATVFVLGLPYFQTAFVDLFVSRYRQTVEQLEDEARVTETGYVWDEFLHKGTRHTLFGSEIFNSPQYFYENLYFRTKRQLHVDYNKILHGSGLIGLTLFGFMYVALFVDFRRALRPWRSLPLARTSRATFIGLCVGSLAMSAGSDMEYVGSRSILFVYLGAFIGVAEEASRRVRLASGPIATARVAPRFLPTRTSGARGRGGQ